MTLKCKGRMGQKGYIFTVSTFFLMTSILLIAMYVSSKAHQPPSAAPKLAALYDDIRGDVYGMLGVSIQTGAKNNLTFVILNDTLPNPSLPGRLARYERYLEDQFSSDVEEHIEGREGSLAGADVTLNFEDAQLLLMPYEYRYQYDTASKNTLRLYPENNNTHLRGLFLNISAGGGVIRFASNISPSNTTGSGMPVRVIIRGSNGTLDMNASISRNGTSYWTLVSDHGFVNVTAGRIFAGSRYRESAFLLDRDALPINIITFAAFRESSLSVDSGFVVRLTDLLGHRIARKEGTIFTELIDYTRIRDTISMPAARINITELPLHVEPEDAPPPIEAPVLLGYCYCAAPCYYWEMYWEGDMPCDLRQCPDWCAPSMMLTYLL